MTISNTIFRKRQEPSGTSTTSFRSNGFVCQSFTKAEKSQIWAEEKWFRLKGIQIKLQLTTRVLREIDSEITDIEESWNRANEIIIKVGEVLGESSGKIWENKETWRFNEEKTVAIDKSEAYDQLYEELETKEGQGEILRKRLDLITCYDSQGIAQKRYSQGEELQIVVTTDSCQVKGGLHQGSVISPFLFNIVFDVLMEAARENPPDDVLVATNGEGDQQHTIQLDRGNTKKAMTEPSGELDKEINHRIQCGWNNWRKVTGVICDRRVPMRQKGKVFREVVRPAMMVGSSCTQASRREETRCYRNEDAKMDVWSDTAGQN
ncbi:uncharacterized protein LOC119584607 [Penaeus monodon]|uniref:uncharacterized protein LOC119584607 n=1 Tax=Penaeus monodon TaxID=6687 RepID=UPI0018A77F58|nr:uncharacterized protein LOC119584607 [Penaeus monodon]